MDLGNVLLDRVSNDLKVCVSLIVFIAFFGLFLQAFVSAADSIWFASATMIRYKLGRSRSVRDDRSLTLLSFLKRLDFRQAQHLSVLRMTPSNTILQKSSDVADKKKDEVTLFL